MHDVPVHKPSLLPYGLGECPFCHRFFTSSRGWSKHTPFCKAPHALLPALKWPQKCWVWWDGDQVWYRGLVLGMKTQTPPSYRVIYPDSEDEFVEYEQFVMFADPSLPQAASSDVNVSVDELEEGEILPTPASPAVTPASPEPEIDLSEWGLGEDVLPTPVIPKKKRLDDLLPDWFLAKSCILLEDEQSYSKNELEPLLIDLFRASSHLRRLPPLRLWRGNQRRLWTRCTKQFTCYFEAALASNPSSTEFLKLCLRLLELPSLILSPTLPAPKAPSQSKASLSMKMRKAESLAFQDRLHEAAKILTSHGISTPSEEVFERLQKLHPPLKQEIPAIDPEPEQFSITGKKVRKALFRHCSETWKSLDPFGWSTALLHLIRGVEAEGSSFFDLSAELIAKLANCQVPDTVAFLFTTGSLVALNKDSAEVRSKRLEEGKLPRERPINQGSMFLKLAFDLALRSKPAQDAAQVLLPIQQGVGAKRGMEVISHCCTAFYQKGYAVLKLDATNGFQELERAQMHRAVARRCPSLLGLFQTYYTHDSVGLYNTGETIKMVKVSEGCRMGCKLSSFGFALTVQDAYLGVQEQLRHTSLDKNTDHSFIKAATDDVILVVKADADNPNAFYKRIRGLGVKLGLEARKIGLSFENDKAQLLLPPGWSPPADPSLLPKIDIRSDVLPNVHQQGMEVVGCPIGSPAFCKSFVRKTVKSMLANSHELTQLHPQAATKLILKCVSAAPAYLSQVCHPLMTKESFTMFDREMWKLWTTIFGGVGLDGEQLQMCDVGIERSRLWSYLPARTGGAGLKCWSTIADYAWFCSFADCTVLHDADFEKGRVFAKKECEEAHAIALNVLGGPTYVNHADFELLPPEEPEVLYDSDYYKCWKEDHKTARIQKEFNNFLAQKLLRDLSSHVALNQTHVTNSEKIRSIQTRKRPDATVLTQLFSASLSDRESRLTKLEFIISARQFIVLAPLKINRGEVIELKCGCEAQKCSNAGCAGATIDPAGNHALVCHAGMGARKATVFERALERVFRKAGGKPTRQPTTFRLLGEVVPKDDLTVLFAGGLNQEQTKANEQLALELVDAFLLPVGVLRDSVIDEVRSRLPVVAEEKKDFVNTTIRFDLCLAASFPADYPLELWLDHAIVQETSDSYQEQVITHLETHAEKGDLTKSVAFRRMETSKQRRFRALISLANHLSKMKLLEFKPLFLFPVISALGFMNEDAEKMVKFMNNVMKKNLPSNRDDGVPQSVLKARFKVEVRNALCFGVARGNSLSMNSVGRPFVSRPV